MSRRCSNLPKRCCLSLGSLQEFGISKIRAGDEVLILLTLWNKVSLLTEQLWRTREPSQELSYVCAEVPGLEIPRFVQYVIYFIYSRQGSKSSVHTHQSINKHMQNQFSKSSWCCPQSLPSVCRTLVSHAGDISIIITPYKDDNLFWQSKDTPFKINFREITFI